MVREQLSGKKYKDSLAFYIDNRTNLHCTQQTERFSSHPDQPIAFLNFLPGSRPMFCDGDEQFGTMVSVYHPKIANGFKPSQATK